MNHVIGTAYDFYADNTSSTVMTPVSGPYTVVAQIDGVVFLSTKDRWDLVAIDLNIFNEKFRPRLSA